MSRRCRFCSCVCVITYHTGKRISYIKEVYSFHFCLQQIGDAWSDGKVVVNKRSIGDGERVRLVVSLALLVPVGRETALLTECLLFPYCNLVQKRMPI